MAHRLPQGSRLLLTICLFVLNAFIVEQARAQAVIDEARQAGRAAQTFPAADEDYFRAMDGGIALTPDEVKGRNMWLVWTGGDDRLWDELTNLTFGSFDLLKILSSYPGLKYSRDNRWNYFGLVNEPCFTKATGPNPQRYGLWLDMRSADCPADPFENAEKYPGVAIGARGKNIPAGSYYGYPSGIPNASITTPIIICRKSSSDRTASGFPAVSAMSGRTPGNRPRTPRRLSGRI